MSYSRKIPVFVLVILAFSTACSQKTQFSLATDLSGLRSFKKEQRFWSIGQTVHLHFNFTPRDGAYAWISYYANGKFKNEINATAKSPATTPQQINYRNNVELRFKHVSLGWKRYLKGVCDTEKKSNIYGYAGFGLMIGSIVNTHSVSVDTSTYNVPVLSGKAHFKRLTFDLGLGYEVPIGADIFLYAEGRALIPTTDYPSKYLFVNNNAPFTAALNIGLRILFN